LFLQRFFTAFPFGWPGVALLFLRLTVAALVAAQGAIDLLSFGHSSGFLIMGVLQVLAGIFLSLGFYTPVTAASLCLGIACSSLPFLAPAAWSLFCAKQTVILAAVMSGVIVLIGPGAFSIDSYLFGRRELVIPPGRYGSRKR
jgi:uncharacterized membrane protein YphA (DoxX/SURF4 family)